MSMVERDVREEAGKLLVIVEGELVEAEEFIRRLKRPTPNRALVNVIVICLILASAALMLFFEKWVLIWLIVALLLYSFNFIVWFLPTTEIGGTWSKREHLDLIGTDFKGPVRYLLKRRKMLGVEVFLTIFLAGMVPLCASFYVLFGLGLPYVFYYGLAQGHIYPWNVFSLVTQICVILAFFGLLLVIRPETRGFSRLGRFVKGSVGRARLRGKEALIISVAVIAVAMALLGALFVGAMLLPGGTLNELVGFLGRDWGLNFILAIFALLVEFAIMRQLQSISSRKMARELLIGRIVSLKEVKRGLASPGLDLKGFEGAARSFYGLVLLKVYENNFLGRWPVYVIGPEVRYFLDKGALAYMD
ncbi:MAG: hypothetical protein MUO18_06680 [Methanomassiliicoccales archaeon]|nr:hypothetical protein [Methanomassiliicoccales archaeon]